LERDLVVGPVAVEVDDRRAGHAPPEANHLASRADQSPINPICTDSGCCCIVEELQPVYRQIKKDCGNPNNRVDSHGFSGE